MAFIKHSAGKISFIQREKNKHIHTMNFLQGVLLGIQDNYAQNTVPVLKDLSD